MFHVNDFIEKTKDIDKKIVAVKIINIYSLIFAIKYLTITIIFHVQKKLQYIQKKWR